MADSKAKSSSIPSWQQPHNTTPTDTSTSQNSDPRTALLEQATKFLQDDSIRDASTDRKVAFLESKGLRNDEIESLLGVSRNAEATSATEASANTTKTTSEETTSSSPNNISQNTSTSSSSPSSSSSSPSRLSSSSPSSSAKTSTPRDVPPIITYPEFLVKQTKPPPLVTLRSILYTLYGAAGLGATLYGTSEYLVKPMIAELTDARHELAQTASKNLKKLNEKLEQNVSTIPPQLIAKNAAESAPDSEDDSDSVTSDPTELFHRDVATQTSADIPQSFSMPGSSENAVNTTPDPTATVTSHLKRLEVINSHLREFNDSENESSSLDDTVRTRLNELHHYLDSLVYSRPGYGMSGYGVFSTPGVDSGRGLATGVGKGEEDAISSFKSEIRGVKGALLSARNFPSGRGGRVGGMSYGR